MFYVIEHIYIFFFYSLLSSFVFFFCSTRPEETDREALNTSRPSLLRVTWMCCGAVIDLSEALYPHSVFCAFVFFFLKNFFPLPCLSFSHCDFPFACQTFLLSFRFLTLVTTALPESDVWMICVDGEERRGGRGRKERAESFERMEKRDD
ncbi:hypothetical protein, unlikely [Trypanosoma congolense IL3000]|uniref:Uncharacterized protein n=1 Tax=Trypanosoma congolense (strain IL3000) TaxID=1068625 RepID=F9WHS2_TRYCI|nr:hypothetical protein, unlikely [Trypanosoma congolense IL3000]